jgi:hypothetical protein
VGCTLSPLRGWCFGSECDHLVFSASVATHQSRHFSIRIIPSVPRVHFSLAFQQVPGFFELGVFGIFAVWG